MSNCQANESRGCRAELWAENTGGGVAVVGVCVCVCWGGRCLFVWDQARACLYD